MEDPTLPLGLPAYAVCPDSPAPPQTGDSDSPGTGQHRRGLRRRHLRQWLALGLGGAALCVSGTAAALYLHVASEPFTLSGLVLGGEPLSEVPTSALPEHVHQIAQRFLAHPVRLRIGQDTVRATYRDLGLSIDEEQAVQRVAALGHSGAPLNDLSIQWQVRRHGLSLPLPVQLAASRALEYLTELKDQVDRSAADARLDLEHHTIAAERPGYLLRVYDSLVSLEYAGRSLAGGQQVPEIELSVAQLQPHVRAADLQDIDVSTVLGSWETRYSNNAIDNDRTYNLKVGAGKLNGHMIRPGELFSFNESVGPRTEREGYRVAPVISGGELVDGLAGGMCQIASTLHAAAFFAGLDIRSSTPHSRPSAYIPMGLDSTVVWPSVDLKLKNPYEFPVVLHYVVNQGSVKVELLGKARPYRVAYEREIVTESDFGVQQRIDPMMPVGQKLIDQEGYPGYHIRRRRYVFSGKWKLDPKEDDAPKPEGLVSRKEWDVFYPATAQIVRMGTGPKALKKREAAPAHRIPPVGPKDKPFFYIVK